MPHQTLVIPVKFLTWIDNGVAMDVCKDLMLWCCYPTMFKGRFCWVVDGQFIGPDASWYPIRLCSGPYLRGNEAGELWD